MNFNCRVKRTYQSTMNLNQGICTRDDGELCSPSPSAIGCFDHCMDCHKTK